MALKLHDDPNTDDDVVACSHLDASELGLFVLEIMNTVVDLMTKEDVMDLSCQREIFFLVHA